MLDAELEIFRIELKDIIGKPIPRVQKQKNIIFIML
jgi:hypothetical protein